MPLTSLLLGQDSMLMLFIYAGFHNRQLARTRLDCDLRTPSLVEYPTLLLATSADRWPWPSVMPNLGGFLYLIGGRRVPAPLSAVTVELVSLAIVVGGEKLAR